MAFGAWWPRGGAAAAEPAGSREPVPELVASGLARLRIVAHAARSVVREPLGLGGRRTQDRRVDEGRLRDAVHQVLLDRLRDFWEPVGAELGRGRDHRPGRLLGDVAEQEAAVGVDVERLAHPVVQAPMAGGQSTPELAAAVSGAGGLGFLAAGYKPPELVRSQIAAVRALTSAPFGVNVFVPSPPGAVDDRALEAYLERLAGEARRYGAGVGVPAVGDDAWADKLALVAEERVAVVSFTFGCPPADVVAGLHAAGAAVWGTVTEVAEARAAAAAGADALVVQGVEAGGHRASFVDDDGSGDLGLLALLRLVAAEVDRPLVAAGGLGDGAGVAAVLAAGAAAAQLGTAFLRCPEAGTDPAYRTALAEGRRTQLTRAFSGRRARGLVNRFVAEHGPHAPAAYPHVNSATAPLRAAARLRGDAEGYNLWAGQAHPLAEELPAAELVRRLGEDARAALERAAARWTRGDADEG